MFGFKFLAAAFAGQLERLSNGVLAGFHLLIPFPAFDAMPFELFLPLNFFLGQLRCGKLKMPDELQINFNFLHSVAVHLFGSMDNDLVDKLVNHHRGQL